MAFNLSCTAAELNAAVAKANAAAPQSTTYTKTEVDTALSGKVNAADLATAVFGNGTAIEPAEGTTVNMDDYTTPGVYHCTADYASRVLPFYNDVTLGGTPFTMIVLQGTNATSVRQIIFFEYGSSRIYTRLRENGYWNGYFEFDLTSKSFVPPSPVL